MSDTEDQEFDESFKGFGDDPAPVTPAVDPATPPAAPGAAAEPPKADPPKPPEEPKKDDETPPADPNKEEEPETPPADPEKKPEDPAKPPETPETPAAPEAPQPLTKDDVQEVVSSLLNNERNSSKELETASKEVLDAYYPDGLSNVLVTPEGKELKSPQDVVDASNGEMTTDQAAQWLMNEQYKLDQQVNQIKNEAGKIAETTLNFKRDAVTAVAKYEPLFKAYPTLQKKVFDKMMEQVKVDKDKDVILSAPDVMSHYDFYLEPYQQAFEYAKGTPATNPTPPADGEPPKPGAEDRMDEGGDGGQTPANDPNDFAQQVTKELAKEL